MQQISVFEPPSDNNIFCQTIKKTQISDINNEYY